MKANNLDIFVEYFSGSLMNLFLKRIDSYERVYNTVMMNEQVKYKVTKHLGYAINEQRYFKISDT